MRHKGWVRRLLPIVDDDFWQSFGWLVPDSFVSSWIMHMRSTHRHHQAQIVLVMVALLLRCCIALNSFSGEGKAPMHGDFEAQRHWMEITWNLPISTWYKQTTDNDLQYWGLDYPPVTAYVSWFFGAIAHYINPDWVALHTSRGLETNSLKLFMRATVLFCDLIIYIPSAFYFCSVFYRRFRWQGSFTACLFLLLQPPLLLIDHGHFQYNTVMLGLTMLAVALIIDDHRYFASVSFCIALCFKQMSLYYSPAFFFFLLGDVVRTTPSILTRFIEVIIIGLFVVMSFVASFWPFLTLEGLGQVFNRVFPFGRGLYEDKVANIWCALSLVIKFKNIFDISTVIRLSILMTLIAMSPASIDLLLRPTKRRFVYSLFNISLAFFLFSFQVHEKSILLVTLPAAMLALEQTVMATWFIGLANFSMFPLLKKDGLVIPYIASMIYWAYLSAGVSQQYGRVSRLMKAIMRVSYAGIVIIHLLEALISPPAQYPDLFTMMNVLLSASMFSVSLIYFNVRQYQLPPVEEIYLRGQPRKDSIS